MIHLGLNVLCKVSESFYNLFCAFIIFSSHLYTLFGPLAVLPYFNNDEVYFSLDFNVSFFKVENIAFVVVMNELKSLFPLSSIRQLVLINNNIVIKFKMKPGHKENL